MSNSFRDLQVWKKSIDLTMQVYKFTENFPTAETYGLTSQMRRASVSIASNIAEGSARGTRRDFRQFVKLAHGSNCELQPQLIIASKLRFGDPAKSKPVEMLSHEVGRMLSSLSNYLTALIQLTASRARPLSTDN